MQFNKISVSADRAVFDDEYTRENNPAVYFERMDFSNKNIHSLNGFPRVIASEDVDLSNNFLSDLHEFPKFQSDDIARKCLLRLCDNPISSLEGAPEYLHGFNIANCSNLASLSNCPEISGYINVEGCKSLKDMCGLKSPLSKNTDEGKGFSSNISIIANRSGLTSFKGFPRQVDNLIVTGCNDLRIFDDFPSKVARLDITIYRSFDKFSVLSELHDKFNYSKDIGIVNLFSDDDSSERMVLLSRLLKEIEDPFDFQNACIRYDFEKYLPFS